MYFFMMMLYKEDLLDDILTTFIEVGINDVVVVEGTNIGRTLAFEVPLFAALKKALDYNRRYSYAIFGFSKDKNSMDQFVVLAKKEGIDLNKPGTGILAAMPVDIKYGVSQELAF